MRLEERRCPEGFEFNPKKCERPVTGGWVAAILISSLLSASEHTVSSGMSAHLQVQGLLQLIRSFSHVTLPIIPSALDTLFRGESCSVQSDMASDHTEPLTL